jgi:hypothetical protein
MIDPRFKGIRDLSDQRKEYDKYVPLWKKYIDVYSGGINMKKPEYLPKESIETDEEYRLRFKYSYYPSYTKKVINDYTKYIFKENPIRDGLDHYINLVRFHSENGRVLSINSFWKEFLSKKLIYGEMFIIYGHDEVSGIVLSDKIRKEKDIRFKVQVVNPINVPVFNKDRAVISLNPSLIKYDSKTPFYMEFNEHGTAYFNQRGELLSVEESNNRKNLPIERFVFDEDNDGNSESLIRDIADINILIYQLSSSLMIDFKKQTYSPFLMPVSASLNQEFYPRYYGVTKSKNTDGNQEEKINFRLMEIMPVPEEGFEGRFLTKDTGFIDQKRDYIKSLREEIRLLSSQRFEELKVQSGIAKYMDIEDSNMALYMLSNQTVRDEIEFWEKWFAIQGKTVPENISIEYNQSFDIKDQEKEIEIKNNFLDKYFNVSKTATKKLLTEYLTDISTFSVREKKEIKKEVDNYVDINIKNVKENMFKGSIEQTIMEDSK